MKHPKARPLPSIQTILLGVSLLFLILPLGSLYFLRIYQSALIRQTESELISQAAFVSALYRTTIAQDVGTTNDNYGLTIAAMKKNHIPSLSASLRAYPAKLDLAVDPVYPPRPVAKPAAFGIDPAARLAGKKIQPVIADAQAVTLSGIKVLDYHGTVVSGKAEYGQSFAAAEEFKRARLGQPVSMLRKRVNFHLASSYNSISRNGTVNVFVALPVTLNNRLIGVVWVNRTPITWRQAIYAKRRTLLWTGLLWILAAGGITVLTALTITKPVKRLIQQTREITEGKTPEPLKRPITREIDLLSHNLSRMADALKQRNDYLNQFAHHVSHEFKTPLASIQGSVELIREDWDAMTPAQRDKFTGNVLADVDRMTRLVNGMLNLTKADTTELISGSCKLERVLAGLSHYQARGLPLEWDSDAIASAPAIDMLHETVEAVLSNLLENSLQHGATHIQFLVAETGKTISIQVKDNGRGISESNQAAIFEPFFTTRRETGGTGLGLNITQSLLQHQGGHISLVSSTSEGTVFQLDLPVL